MLALVLAAALSTPSLPEIHVEVGTTTTVTLDAPGGFGYTTGGTIYLEDPNIATIRGAFAQNEKTAEVTIKALHPGGSRILVQYGSGLSVWHSEVAKLTISPAHDSLPVIYVDVGQRLETEGSIAPARLIYGGTMRSDDDSIASVSGSIAPGRPDR